MSTTRLEALSDGVFAIALTLLVLEFHAPSDIHDLVGFLEAQWPSLVAYAISVLLIGLAWANHHAIFAQIARVDRMLVFLNIILLASIAFVPFPTELLARALPDWKALRIAAFVYGLTLMIGGLVFDAVWFYATRDRRLLEASAPASYIAASRRRFFVGPIAYAAATLLALVAPYAAMVGYVLLILFYWLPPRGERQLPS